MVNRQTKTKLYQQFSVRDFDRYDCLKPPISIYLILFYLLRGYLIFIFSITNLNDKTAILEWFYPDPNRLYATIIAGIPALVIVMVIALRHPDANHWVALLWAKIKWLFIATLSINITFESISYWYWQNSAVDELIIHMLTTIIALVFVVTSQRLTLASQEFPEKLETK